MFVNFDYNLDGLPSVEEVEKRQSVEDQIDEMESVPSFEIVNFDSQNAFWIRILIQFATNFVKCNNVCLNQFNEKGYYEASRNFGGGSDDDSSEQFDFARIS